MSVWKSGNMSPLKRKISFTGIFLFWIIMVQGATIGLNKNTYLPGEEIIVAFDSANTKKDWIGMYKSAITPGPQNNMTWLYLNGEQKVPVSVLEKGTLVFTAPIGEGTYKMCFHPNDGYEVVATAEFKVSASEIAPMANFYGTPFSVLPGRTVGFTDLSHYSPKSWSWTFPGGVPSESSLQNPAVRYDSEGIFSVTLKVANDFGEDQLIRNGYIIVSDSADKAIDVKFMHLNIWLDGTAVPNGNTYIRDIIAKVNPDIVCAVEVGNYAGDWTTKMASELKSIGLNYFGSHVKGSDASILSKFPIVSAGPVLKSAITVFNVDVNGKNIIVAPAHLDYTYYACYLPRGYKCGGSPPYNGWSQIGSSSPEPVTDLDIISKQNLGSQRDEQISAFLDFIDNETDPVVILGDFNEPSHQDWTSKQAEMFDHNGVIYKWNTTFSLTGNNFVDAFREIYPDEVLNPGITWPSFATGVGSTSWTPKSDERERIDYIFYRGSGVKAVNAAIIGPRNSYVYNVLSSANTDNENFMADSLPWPSDHKGVFATLTIPSASDTINVSVAPTFVKSPSQIKVYPNPGTGIFNLEASENSHFNINITNVFGKTLSIEKMSMDSGSIKSFDISGYPDGFYLLNIVSGHNSQTLKIIKQK